MQENEVKKMIAGTYAYKLLELSLAWDKMCLQVIKATPLRYFIKTNLLQRRITKTRLYLKNPAKWMLGDKWRKHEQTL